MELQRWRTTKTAATATASHPATHQSPTSAGIVGESRELAACSRVRRIWQELIHKIAQIHPTTSIKEGLPSTPVLEALWQTCLVGTEAASKRIGRLPCRFPATVCARNPQLRQPHVTPGRPYRLTDRG